MLASSSLVSCIREYREYALVEDWRYDRKVTLAFHLPELSAYIYTTQRHMSRKEMVAMEMVVLRYSCYHCYVTIIKRN